MISIFPGRPREWNSSASASVYLTLLSDIPAPSGEAFRPRFVTVASLGRESNGCFDSAAVAITARHGARARDPKRAESPAQVPPAVDERSGGHGGGHARDLAGIGLRDIRPGRF